MQAQSWVLTAALRNCRRAFGRLAERWGEARQELKELKDLKKRQWKATVACAVRAQLNSAPESDAAASTGAADFVGDQGSDSRVSSRAPEPAAAASAGASGRAALSLEERAVLGRDGLVRVRPAWCIVLAYSVRKCMQLCINVTSFKSCQCDAAHMHSGCGSCSCTI